MAYNRSDRFPPKPSHYRLFEPAAYQYDCCYKNAPNKAPFLSKTKRKTSNETLLWTHAIYQADQPAKIPTCTTLMSKRPRFPYEAFSKEDIEDVLCKCGLQNVCECPETNEQIADKECHAKIYRRLFKGHPPRSAISEGLSTPSRRDQGFRQMSDGTVKRIFNIETDQSPPFYDAKVNESTAFYQGCKWSKRTSTRTVKSQEQRPGPADYNIARQPTFNGIRAELVRENKRKHSKQFRYIEMIQRRELLEGRPGPASYSPQTPRGVELQFIGSKADRFYDLYYQYAGAADHWIKRDFDPPEVPVISCQAKLPKRSCFGTNASRFKSQKEEGPSPATYNPNYKQCSFLRCSIAPFGTTSQRFKSITKHVKNESDEVNQNVVPRQTCPKTTWEFKSKTIRMKPLVKKPFEQSPADFSRASTHYERAKQLQYISPFFSSEGRFQPWYDWMPVFGRVRTPGPGYYNPKKHTCQPSVRWGSLSRTERFPINKYETPAPNEYKVDRGVETILSTYNKFLRSNIKKQHKWCWKPPVDTKKLSVQKRQLILLKKSTAMLEVDESTGKDTKPEKVEVVESTKRPKLLRCFLNKQQIL